VIYANPAAEASFAVSRKAMVELSLPDLFGASEELDSMFETVMARQVDVRRQDLVLRPPLQEPMHAHVVIGGVEGYATQRWSRCCSTSRRCAVTAKSAFLT
jgi:two-component system nitrogen regulation sensor histidine kinase GlnL